MCVCERASVGGVKYQRSTIQQSVTEPNQRAASPGGGAERAAAAKAHACAQPLKTPAGGGRKHPEKTGYVGRHAVPAGSPTNRDSWSEVLWTDESECWTSDLLCRMEVEVSGTLQRDDDPKHSSKSAKDWLGPGESWNVRGQILIPLSCWWVKQWQKALKHLTAEKVKLFEGSNFSQTGVGDWEMPQDMHFCWKKSINQGWFLLFIYT